MKETQNEIWLEAWKEGRIPFHLADTNPSLIKFLPSLSWKKGGRVFVPLCGKSKDLLYLSEEGFEVIGVELSSLAVQDFFQENKISHSVEDFFGFQKFVSKDQKICVYCGDIFRLKPEWFFEFTGIYDRGSLIALPQDLRKKYAAHLQSLFARESYETFMIVVDYDQKQMEGPPFSVPDAEIRSLYSWMKDIEILAEDRETPEPGSALYERGLRQRTRRVYALRHRPGFGI